MEQRAGFGPVLVLGVRFEDLRAGIGFQAPPEPPVGPSRNGIEDYLVREGELKLGIPARNMLAMSSSGLRKAIIEETSARPAQVVVDCIKNAIAIRIVIES
jgi:hypothetical protein